MDVSLTPELERRIEERLASGAYASASDLVREALRVFFRQETAGAGGPGTVDRGGDAREPGAADAAVVEDPEILNGTPVLRGTRIPAHDVAASLERFPLERVLDAYPGLTAEAAEAARQYARTHPVRDHSRPLGERLPGAVLIEERRIPR